MSKITMPTAVAWATQLEDGSIGSIGFIKALPGFDTPMITTEQDGIVTVSAPAVGAGALRWRTAPRVVECEPESSI